MRIGDAPIGKRFGCIVSKQTIKETIDYINKTEIDLIAMRTSANSYKMHYEQLEAEVQRLKGIINKDVLLVRPRNGKTEKIRQMILIRAKEIKSESIKEFAHFLIDKSEHGVISVADLPEYVTEMRSRIDERFEVSENKVEQA